MRNFILLAFLLSLIGCLLLDIPLISAMLLGYVLFAGYTMHAGSSLRDIVRMTVSSIWQIRMVLIVFVLIGMLTASWRAGGTIPCIVSMAESLIRPEIFPLLAFLLNAALSIMLGTSFGTAATMGVICMSIGSVIGVPPAVTGGAVLSGIYVGDRCSPLSTSALVVSSITQTDIYDNLILMAKSAIRPLLISCVLYLIIGIYISPSPLDVDTTSIFGEHFDLSGWTLLPALSVIIMSCLRIDVRKTMIVSLLLSCACCFLLQGMRADEIITMLIKGYTSPDKSLQSMLGGGGIFSMKEPGIIISLSCSYAGFFQHVDILKDVKKSIDRLSGAVTLRGSVIIVATLTSMIACNQTLSSILTQQLCSTLVPDKRQMMLAIENTAIVIAGLIPWSIACSVPLHTMGVSASAVFFAFYLFLQPFAGITSHTKKASRKAAD